MVTTNTSLWQTQKGKLVRVCDMNDDHLLNCIKYIKTTVKKEFVNRGHILTMGFGLIMEDGSPIVGQEAADRLVRCAHAYRDILDEMVDEAEQRGLVELKEDDGILPPDNVLLLSTLNQSDQ